MIRFYTSFSFLIQSDSLSYSDLHSPSDEIVLFLCLCRYRLISPVRVGPFSFHF